MSLHINHVSHQYSRGNDYIQVLRDINLVIEPGDFVAVVGPSGSGKTTLANIILGYIKPFKGEVKIKSRKVSGPGKDRIPISQENDLFDWMTVYQNMRIATNDSDAINQSLRMVHLDSDYPAYPAQLSGGMKKRLSLARAVAAKPDIIVMDEPFASIDYQLKRKLHEELTQVHKSLNNSVMLVTHDIEEAIFLSSRVVILGGKPASIKDIIDIKFEYPRAQNITESAQFINYKRHILTILNGVQDHPKKMETNAG